MNFASSTLLNFGSGSTVRVGAWDLRDMTDYLDVTVVGGGGWGQPFGAWRRTWSGSGDARHAAQSSVPRTVW